MLDQEMSITETDWGFHIVMRKGISFEDGHLLRRIINLMDICKARGKNKLLIDASTTRRNATGFELFQGIELMQRLGCSGFRIANVTPHPANDRDSRFVNTAGYNRGISINYFLNEGEAIEWLLNK